MSMVLFFFLFLIISAGSPESSVESGNSIQEVQRWFSAYYQPEFAYRDSAEFSVGGNSCFSPFHIDPDWSAARSEELRSSVGKKKRGTIWIVPVSCERLAEVGYRFKNQETDPRTWAYHPVEQYLIIVQKKKKAQAFIRSYLRVSDVSEAFTGMIVDSDVNTGDMYYVTYIVEGDVRGARKWRLQDRAADYSFLIGMDYGGRIWPQVLEYDTHFHIVNLERSAPYKQAARSEKGRQEFHDQWDGNLKNVRFRSRSRRGPYNPAVNPKPLLVQGMEEH